MNVLLLCKWLQENNKTLDKTVKVWYNNNISPNNERKKRWIENFKDITKIY